MKNTLRKIFAILALLPAFAMAQQWPYAPVTISTPGQDASDQKIDLDINGNFVAIWLESGVVKSNSGTISGGWSPTIDTLSGASSSEPRVLIDNSGNATAVWIESGMLFAETKPFNGSWPGSPDLLSGSGASSPEIARDASGNIVAVWEENGVVHSATKLFNGSWPVSSDTLSASGTSSPQVGIGDNGTVVAIWQGLISTTPTIYAATKPVAGSWTAASAISSAGVNSCYPQIVVDGNGNATATWFRYAITGSIYSNVYVQSSSLPYNGSWSAPENISDAGIVNPAVLASQIIATPSGNVMAVWTTSMDGASYLCEWNVYSNGSWLYKPGVFQSSNLLAYDLDIDADSDGNIYVAWMKYDRTSSSPIIYGALDTLSRISSGFGNAWTLSAGGDSAYPIGAVSVSGNTLNTAGSWVNFNGTNNVIQAVTGSFTFPQPPSNLAVVAQVNNFGVLTETSNVLSWDASPSPYLLTYVIYRNGEQIGWVGSNTLQFSDENRLAGESGTYGIMATDSRGYQSSIVTVPYSN